MRTTIRSAGRPTARSTAAASRRASVGGPVDLAPTAPWRSRWAAHQVEVHITPTAASVPARLTATSMRARPAPVPNERLRLARLSHLPACCAAGPQQAQATSTISSPTRLGWSWMPATRESSTEVQHHSDATPRKASTEVPQSVRRPASNNQQKPTAASTGVGDAVLSRCHGSVVFSVDSHVSWAGTPSVPSATQAGAQYQQVPARATAPDTATTSSRGVRGRCNASTARQLSARIAAPWV